MRGEVRHGHCDGPSRLCRVDGAAPVLTGRTEFGGVDAARAVMRSVCQVFPAGLLLHACM